MKSQYGVEGETRFFSAKGRLCKEVRLSLFLLLLIGIVDITVTAAPTTDTAEVMHKNLQHMMQLSPETASPLQKESDLQEENRFNSHDKQLSMEERKDRLAACLQVVQTHYSINAAEYIAAIRESTVNHGMRDDDALRLMVHSSWVACYYNANTIPGLWERISLAATESEDVVEALHRDKNTPTHFSVSQTVLVEEMASKHNTQARSPAYINLSGWTGVVYSLSVVTVVFSLLFVGYRSLRSAGENRGRKKREDKKGGKTPATKHK